VKASEATMYWRRIRFVVRPGTIDAALRRSQAVMLAPLKQEAGYRGATVESNPAANEVSVTTWWASEVDRATSRAARLSRAQLGTLAQLLAKPPTVREGEMRSHGSPRSYWS
jgi:hypothetical protein